jgi:hypothetical protein
VSRGGGKHDLQRSRPHTQRRPADSGQPPRTGGQGGRTSPSVRGERPGAVVRRVAERRGVRQGTVRRLPGARDLPRRRALERREPWGVWGGQLFIQGVVVPRKRPVGRPRKNEVAA